MTNTDFVVTIHAFERLEERFPSLVEGLSDKEQAELVHEEVMDAFDGGRYGKVPPLELASKALEQWITRQRGSIFVWTKDKTRGYLVREDPEEGMLIVTVLFGTPLAQASSKIKTRRKI